MTVFVGHWMSELRRDDTCQNARVRIGTCNLESKCSSNHLALLEGQECDGWFLTAMPSEASIPDTKAHRTAHVMCPRKTWAGIFSSRDLTTQPDPHCDGLRLMCSVLPWRSRGASREGSAQAEKMSSTLSSFREHIDETTIRGGDWNQALESRERPSVHGPVLAVGREVLALGPLATSDGGPT